MAKPGRPKGKPLSSAELEQRRQPRLRIPKGIKSSEPSPRPKRVGESFTAARTRREIAAADSTEINRDAARIALRATCATLVKADAVRDRIEKLHARWVMEVEQLAGFTVAALPVDVALRSQVATAIETQVRALLERIASAKS